MEVLNAPNGHHIHFSVELIKKTDQREHFTLANARAFVVPVTFNYVFAFSTRRHRRLGLELLEPESGCGYGFHGIVTDLTSFFSPSCDYIKNVKANEGKNTFT